MVNGLAVLYSWIGGVGRFVRIAEWPGVVFGAISIAGKVVVWLVVNVWIVVVARNLVMGGARSGASWT